jgi:hypothetical protein
VNASLGCSERSIAQLDRLFLLVVIGEFNSGKSAFVNALVGARMLEECVTPTTTKQQVLQYGETSGAMSASGRASSRLKTQRHAPANRKAAGRLENGISDSKFGRNQ